MTSTVNVNVNINLVRDMQNINPAQFDRHEHTAAEVSDRVLNNLHNPIDKLISAVTRKILRKSEIFVVKMRGLTKRLFKALLKEYLPDIALKVIRIAPAILAISI
jgi:hypothetical protein